MLCSVISIELNLVLSDELGFVSDRTFQARLDVKFFGYASRAVGTVKSVQNVRRYLNCESHIIFLCISS